MSEGVERAYKFSRRVRGRFSEGEVAKNLFGEIIGHLEEKTRFGSLPRHNQISYLKAIVRTCAYFGREDVCALGRIRNRVRNAERGVLKLNFYKLFELVRDYYESNGNSPDMWRFSNNFTPSLIDLDRRSELSRDRKMSEDRENASKRIRGEVGRKKIFEDYNEGQWRGR